MTTGFLLALAGIAVLDSVNPSATAIQLYLLGTPTPYKRAWAFLAGVFLTNYLGGFLAVLGFGVLLRDWLENLGLPSQLDARLILGPVLLLVALWLRPPVDSGGPVRRPRTLRPLHVLLLGVTITFAELPTALPYLAAIAMIADARLSIPRILVTLLFYNLLFILPLVVLLVVFWLSAAHLASLRRWVTYWAPRAMRIFLAILGAALTADGAWVAAGHPSLLSWG